MKTQIIRLSFIAAIAASLVSCLPESEYMYTETGMCTIINSSQLQTDNGQIFNIVENNSGGVIPDTLLRVMTVCDVLTQVIGKADEYNVRLMEFETAFSSEPLEKSTMDEEAVGNNGINVNQAWAMGGYLSGYSSIAMLNPSESQHTLNLVYDDLRSSSDTLFLELRHNANGECPENTEIPLNSFVFAGSYFSFPIKDLVVSDKQIIHLEWDWYVGDEYTFTREKKKHTGDIPQK